MNAMPTRPSFSDSTWTGRLQPVSSNPAGLSVSLQAGKPGTIALAGSTSQPKDGDAVQVSVRNPDGSQSLVDLTARTAGGQENTFAIGDSFVASVKNLAAAVAPGTVIGFKIGDSASTVVAFGSSTPAAATVTVGAGLQAGDSVQVTVGLRDGTSKTLSLKAAADGTGAGTFADGVF